MPSAPREPAASSRLRGVRWLGPWVLEVNAGTLRADLLAALLAVVLVLPQGLAFAALAGLPPVWGLYSAIVPAVVAALAGSSRLVLTGPTNTLALALAASLAPMAAAGTPEYLRLALVLTLMVGALQLLVAVTRLGSLTHFIAPSVLLGFTTGAAALIAWHALRGIVPGPQAVQGGELAVAAVTLASALALRRWAPRWPGMLLALVVGTGLAVVLAALAGLPIARVGALPQAWPVWQPPALAWDDLPRLATTALALTLIALGQTVAIAKVLAARTDQPLNVDRECLGQGLANVAGSFFSSFVVCGSLNRSLPYWQAGARTPLGGVFAAGGLLLLVAVAAPVLSLVPMVAIAALLLPVALALVDTTAWRELWRADRPDALIAAGTAVATVLLPIEAAILGGVAASLVLYLHRTAHPALRTMVFDAPPAPGRERPFVVQQAGEPECPQLKLLRMEGPVWFGAAAHVSDALAALRDGSNQGSEAGPPRHLLVMGKSMNFIDAAGAQLWEQERRRRLAAGGDLYFHRPRPQVLTMWQTTGFTERLGADHLFATKREAIAHIVPRLDPAVCAGCRARVFEECAAQPGPPSSVAAGSTAA